MTPYEWTKEEAQIIKGCWANEHGRLALTLVVERLGNLHGSSFAPDMATMAHGEGRRWVAQQLMRAINLPLEKVVKEEPHERSNRTLTGTERAAAAAAGSPAYKRRT